MSVWSCIRLEIRAGAGFESTLLLRCENKSQHMDEKRKAYRTVINNHIAPIGFQKHQPVFCLHSKNLRLHMEYYREKRITLPCMWNAVQGKNKEKKTHTERERERAKNKTKRNKTAQKSKANNVCCAMCFVSVCRCVNKIK